MNDVITGEPVPDAAITMQAGGKEISAVTNEDGLARAEGMPAAGTQSDPVYVPVMFTVQAGERTYAGDDLFRDSGAIQDHASRQYMGYLCSDRNIYRPYDTMKIWGMVKNRNSAPLPASVLVDVGEDTVSVPLEADGTFMITAPISGTDDVPIDRVILRIEEDIIAETRVQVAPSTSGGYRLALRADAPAFVMQGVTDSREASATLRVTDNLGNAVPGLQVRLSNSGGLDRITTEDRLVTNENGLVTNRWRVHEDQDT